MSKQNKLAEFLKEHREKSFLSQAEVAQKLGYSTPQFISNWERGVSAPPINTIRKIASLYKVTAEELFELQLAATLDQVAQDMRRKFYKK